MEIKIIKSRGLEENCYLITNNNEGILIDPGEDTFEILKNIENIDVKYILLTHCHFDHIYSLSEIRGSKTVLGSKNLKRNITNTKIVLANLGDDFNAEIDDVFLDNEERNLCGLNVKCIYTPGHTDCSCCYLIDNTLFSGDTLFFGSIGRCDFPTGNFDELENSIRNKLYKLPDETTVYSGHGSKTTIGNEKKYGYFKEEI